MDALTTLTIISPVKVGVTICVFLFNAMYLLDTNFFTISALVALVPIPLPLICSLKSSS